MLRREFCKSLTALFFLPSILQAKNESIEDTMNQVLDDQEIESVCVTTSFELQPVFTLGELREYEPVHEHMKTNLIVTYKSGKKEKYCSTSPRHKTWISVKNEMKCRTILSRTKKTIKIWYEDCCCIITGLKPV